MTQRRPPAEPDSIDPQLEVWGRELPVTRSRDRGNRRADLAPREPPRPVDEGDARRLRPQPGRMEADGAPPLRRAAVPRQAGQAREAPGALERRDDESPRQHGAAWADPAARRPGRPARRDRGADRRRPTALGGVRRHPGAEGGARRRRAPRGREARSTTSSAVSSMRSRRSTARCTSGTGRDARLRARPEGRREPLDAVGGRLHGARLERLADRSASSTASSWSSDESGVSTAASGVPAVELDDDVSSSSRRTYGSSGTTMRISIVPPPGGCACRTTGSPAPTAASCPVGARSKRQQLSSPRERDPSRRRRPRAPGRCDRARRRARDRPEARRAGRARARGRRDARPPAPLPDGARLELLTTRDRHDPDALAVLRHSAAHLLAEAVRRLYPGVKVAIGPPIENGFYYDFEFPGADPRGGPRRDRGRDPPRELAEGRAWERVEIGRDEARAASRRRASRTRRSSSTQRGGDISLYTQGDFTDLCRGPHLQDSSPIKAVKLTWRSPARTGAATSETRS